MRAIICCGGEASRWDGYLGYDKCFIPIDSEPLVYRTVRLLQKFNVFDIWCVLRTNFDVPGTRTMLTSPSTLDTAKFTCTIPCWGQTDDLIILFGDTYFSEDAIARITRGDPPITGFTAYGHLNKTSIKPYGEIYAVRFTDREGVQSALDKMVKFQQSHDGATERQRPSGWNLYLRMAQLALDEVSFDPRFFSELPEDDPTDDFDYPYDYDKWVKQWRSEC